MEEDFVHVRRIGFLRGAFDTDPGFPANRNKEQKSMISKAAADKDQTLRLGRRHRD